MVVVVVGRVYASLPLVTHFFVRGRHTGPHTTRRRQTPFVPRRLLTAKQPIIRDTEETWTRDVRSRHTAETIAGR